MYFEGSHDLMNVQWSALCNIQNNQLLERFFLLLVGLPAMDMLRNCRMRFYNGPDAKYTVSTLQCIII